MFKQWQGFIHTIQRYWKNYGGIKAILTSPYFHISIILTILTLPFWWIEKWWDNSLSIIPNILGFTLGGFAIFLGYGNDKFRSLMACEDEKGYSPYMEVVSSFLHFVIIQICSIIISLIAKSLDMIPNLIKIINKDCICYIIISKLTAALGYTVFLYSILLAFATSFALYRLASIYSQFETMEHKNQSNNVEE